MNRRGKRGRDGRVCGIEWPKRVRASGRNRRGPLDGIGRHRARKKAIERRPKRVEIASGVARRARDLFGRREVRGVAGKARSGRATVGGRPAARESEVEQADRPVGRDLQILRLDVAVDDRRLV